MANTVSYFKTKGYYLADSVYFLHDTDARNAKQAAELAFQKATDIGYESLSATHPVWLDLVMNHAVFCYEVLHQPERACKLIKVAFDRAIVELEALSEDSFKVNEFCFNFQQLNDI